jgi:hypothetical protein
MFTRISRLVSAQLITCSQSRQDVTKHGKLVGADLGPEIVLDRLDRGVSRRDRCISTGRSTDEPGSPVVGIRHQLCVPKRHELTNELAKALLRHVGRDHTHIGRHASGLWRPLRRTRRWSARTGR